MCAALIVLATLVVSIFSGVFLRDVASQSDAAMMITLDGVPIFVSIAATEEARARGLSGRPYLAVNRGMLFVFETDGRHAFWMHDMLFSIDILWISHGRVVDIEKNLSPDTFPTIFTPDSNARYVLELPAGFSDAHGVGVGSEVVLRASSNATFKPF